MTFKPMLASPANFDRLVYPVYGSPKLDGIRASVVGGRLLSRTLKEIPSRHIYNMFNQVKFEGLDGELIVGDPTNETCYRDTVSGVMADDKTPSFTYYVFDKWNVVGSMSFRLDALRTLTHELDHKRIKRVVHELIEDRAQLEAYEAKMVALGYEGVMLAAPNAAYKHGRATVKGGELLKVKRFEDSEAVVLGIVEEEFNGNDAETNELGRTKRSSAKAGKVGKGSMGALLVRDWKTNVEFNIGTGFTAADRAAMWDKPPIGETVKYKFFPVGVKDKPRHPVYLGTRPVGA